MIFTALCCIFVSAVYLAQIASASSPWEDYVACRDGEQFGNVSLVCDLEDKLRNRTLKRLDSLLRDLQSKIPCECANGCERGAGLSDKYIGLLLVTSDAKINESESSLNETAKRIFEDAKLGDVKCDNGLLIVYNKDTQMLATYRGSGRFALLSDKDMARLGDLAEKDWTMAPLKNLVLDNEGTTQQERPDVQRSDSLAPIVGLTVTLVVLLIALALVLSFLMAKILGCCYARRESRKDSYNVTPPIPPYSSVQPIYILTPPPPPPSVPMSTLRRPHHASNGRFYGSTPSLHFANSPSPLFHPPHPPPPLSPLPPLPRPIVTYPPRSRSATPTSRSRTRVQPKYSTATAAHESTGRSAAQTPQAIKREKVMGTSTPASNAGYFTPGIGASGDNGKGVAHRLSIQQSSIDGSQEAAAGTSQRMAVSVHPQYSTTVSEDNGVDTESSGFSFLDPRRKQEVQTRERYIG